MMRPMTVPMIVASRPTVSEVRAPQTMRAHTSQPRNVKPSGCPSVGPPLLFASWQSLFGGTCVNRVGQMAMSRTMATTSRLSQNTGRRRRSRHASDQRLLGFSSTRTASTTRVVVGAGAT